jgi:ABC-2 type transport system permease protein
MRQLLAFTKKEFRHIFRDPWTMAILLLLPITMLILFGFALTTEVKGARVAVYDPSDDEATRGIVERLAASDRFVVDRYLKSPAEIDRVFRSGEESLILVFPGRFQEELFHTREAQVQLIADGSDPNTANTVVAYASSVIAEYLAELRGPAGLPLRIKPEVRLLYNPQLKGAYNFVPGVMGMVLMLVCAMMTSISIAREKEEGTMEVLLVSPMRPLSILVAKVLPYFVLSLVDLAIILLLSVFVLGVPIAGSLFWLIVLSLVYILLSLALGLLISSVVKTQVVALLISGMALMMPVILLSGMVFPIENMPLLLRLLSNLVPARWYIEAVRKIMIKGLGLSSILTELGILSCMAAALLAVSLGKFKARLE